MTVKNVQKDPDRLTMTLTAEFDATVDRVWRLWEDPRQLERWWGPPEYPATFVEHDFSKDGTVKYYMTGPDGLRYHGWWRISGIYPPTKLNFEDGFAGDDGNPNPEMPVTATTVILEEVDGPQPRTRMTLETKFPSLEAMEQMAEMGMEEGLRGAVGQIDDILAEDVKTGA